jgi:sugar lactone lactonase YvrE
MKLYSKEVLALVVLLLIMTMLVACGEAATPTTAATTVVPTATSVPTTMVAPTTVPPTPTTTVAPTPTTIPPTTLPPTPTAAPAVAKLPYLVVGTPWQGGSLRNAEDGVMDKAGNIYVSDYTTRKVYKFDKDFKFIGFIGPDAQGKPSQPYYLTVDNDSNLYVVDYDDGGIYKYDATGKSLGRFGSSNISDRVESLTSGKDGNIYALTSHPDLIKYDPTGKILNTIAGSGNETSKLAAGQFNYQAHVRVDASGNIFLFETSDPARVQKFDASGKYLLSYAVPKDKDGKPSYIREVLLDSSGNASVVGDEHLWKFGPDGKLSSDTPFTGYNVQRLLAVGDAFVQISISPNYTGLLDATGKVQKKLGASNASALGQFDEPRSIAVDSAGNFFVADYGLDRIQKFDTTGKLLLTIDQKAVTQGFSPHFIALDSAGNIYAAGSSSVVKFSPTGKLMLRFGKDGKEDGQFNIISGLAVDAKGNIYVGDIDRLIVQKFGPDGGFIEKYSIKEKSDDQAFIISMAFDKDGNMYVGRGDDNGILVLGPDGKLKGQLNPNNKLVAEASVYALALDDAGQIYAVFSSTDQPINVIAKDGQVKASYGKQGLNVLEFLSPVSLSVDTGGNIYIAESTGARVQRWNPSDSSVKVGDPIPTVKA